MRNLLLVGPPLSGKSTVGPLLAELLSYGFVDTDAVLGVPPLPTPRDWLDFRRREASLVTALGEAEDLVIACGAGVGTEGLCPVPFDYCGLPVLLEVPEAELHRRAGPDPWRSRPLLRSVRLSVILRERKAHYDFFYKVDGTGAPAEVAARVSELARRVL